MEVESDQSDSDFEIISDDESQNSSESSNSVIIIPPTLDKQGRLMLKASVVERRITEEENFNGGGERVEENDNGKDKKNKDKSLDDEKEDEDEGSQHHEDEVSEDITDDEERQQWAVKEFYKGRPKGFRYQLLKYFYEHLQDLGGGANKERQAGIHVQNVRKLLDHLDPKNDTMSCLLEDGGLQMWRNWGKPILEQDKMRPGTVKAYLSSVGKFLNLLFRRWLIRQKSFQASTIGLFIWLIMS